MMKRVLSLLLALALCFSLLPAAAFAEDAGAEEELQTNGNPNAAVQAAQALLDALPDEATAYNAEELSAQLAAIDEALAALTEEQLAALNTARYVALCEALTGLTAVQEGEHKQAGEHSHPICGATCGHTDSTHPDVEWTAISDLSTITAGTESAPNYYYLTKNIELTIAWNAPKYTVLDLNGHSITMQQEGDAIKVTGSFTLTDCKGGKTEYGKITHKTGVNGRGVNVSEGNTFTMYGGSI